MLKFDEKYVVELRTILEMIDYAFVLKSIRGITDSMDPWVNFNSFSESLKKLDFPFKNIINMFYIGESVDVQEVKECLSENSVNLLIESEILVQDEDKIRTNNLSVLIYQGMFILTELSVTYKTFRAKKTDVYIGFDSLRLAENITFNKDAYVLDLCSGTGIQGLLAARSAKKVISVEINEKASNFAKFNIKLNQLDDIIEVRTGDLYNVLSEKDKFDYIYANAPFIPMLGDVDCLEFAAGGEDGLGLLRNIVNDLPKYLKKNSSTIIFCELLGNKDKVFFNCEVKEFLDKNNWTAKCIILGKMPVDFQMNSMASLLEIYEEDFNREQFIDKMKENYKKIGADYCYSMLYKIDAVDNQNNVDNLSIINLGSSWLYSQLTMASLLNLKDVENASGVFRNLLLSGISRKK